MKKASAPRQTTLIIAVILAFLGVLSSLISIPVLSPLAFWLVVAGFVVLLLGNLVDGM